MSRVAALTIAFFTSTLFACAAETADETIASEEESPVDQSEDALTSGVSNRGFYIVTRRDTRKCVSPMCGGVFVKKVNEATTRCADGSMQAECYVSEITVNGVGFSEREKAEALERITGGKAVVKARQYKKAFGGSILGTLKANEVWLGATGNTPEGTFYRAADNGVRCITTPCPSTSAFELNGTESHNVTRVLFGTTADDASKDAAQNALGTREGVIVAGGVLLPKCPPKTAGCGPLVSAREFYVKAVPREGKACGSRGLGGCGLGQFCNVPQAGACGIWDAAGTCAYRAEMCPAVYLPVCGCDGKTYSNACAASAAGASVKASGACAAP